MRTTRYVARAVLVQPDVADLSENYAVRLKPEERWVIFPGVLCVY
ncbi:MAG: hypothetical protein ACJ8AJ_06275 [Gemmatimonadaceae bacterium]